MFEDTRPAELDATGSGDPWAPFRVGSAHERLRVLRELRDCAVPVLLHSPDGAALTTTLWTLDATQQRLSFNADAAEAQLARLVESDEVVAVAYCDSVKLQFDLHGLVLVRGATASALQCGMPGEVYRFQRRSAYRVRPLAHPLPVAQFRHPAQPDRVLALRIIDLSVGGCALWLPDGVPPLHAGTRLGEMRCELDTETRFTATATVKHVSAPTPEAGDAPRGDTRATGGRRLGCE
ncbi:MAG: flagellar brake protein, partial [Rubrivivax sp.]|nr:flagellar brake protein [Rubrivivax sp.]